MRGRLPTGDFRTKWSGTNDSSRRRWRHIDAGSSKIWLQAEIRRLACRPCGRVVTDAVPWARHGVRHSRDLQDVIVGLAQCCDKQTVRRLLRVSWAAVAHAVTVVVADQLDDARLDGLVRIGVDEISCAPRGAEVPCGGERAPPLVLAGIG